MDVPALFPCFDVRDLWPASLEALGDWLAHVPHGQWRTWCAAPGASDAIDTGALDGVFTRSGVVQICLLHLPLFTECAAGDIRDLREHLTRGPRTHHCQQRPRCVQGLAEALLHGTARLTRPPLQAQTRMDTSPRLLADLDSELLTYHARHLDPQGRFLPSVPKADRFKAKQRELVRRVLHGVVEANAHRLQQVPQVQTYTEVRLDLLHALYEVFLRYGPRPPFGIRARCAAIYVLLAGVHLEKPAPSIRSGGVRVYEALHDAGRLA